MAAKRSVGVRLRMFVDQYKRDAEEAVKANDRVGGSGKKAKVDLDQLAGTLTIVGGLMVAAAGATVIAAARFDKQMSEVGAVANATGDELEHLRDAAIEAGQATAFSASEAAQAEAELAKAGVATADILGGGLAGALSLASAGTLDLATAATIAAQAMNVFDLGGGDVEHIADVLAAAANKSAAGVQDLGIALQQVGLVASLVGFSLEDTVGVLAAFADNALGGSDGATSLKTALLRLASPLPAAKSLMQELGISLYDANGNMVDAVTIAEQLRDGLKDLSAAERNAALNTIFGADSIRAAKVFYDEGAEGIRDYIDAVNDQGAASDVAAAKLDNLAGDFEELTGSLETLFIKSGEGATGPLRFLTQVTTGLVNAFAGLPGPVQATITGVVGVTGVALLGTAAALKFSTGMAALNANLAAAGPAGAKAAVGIRFATSALGGIALALTAAVTAWQIFEIATGRSGGVQRLISPQAVDALSSRLGVVGDSLTDTADRVDAELARMAQSGRGAEAMDLLSEATEGTGRTVEELLSQYPKFAAAVEVAGGVTQEQAAAAGEAAAENVRLAGAFGEAANEAGGLRKAFDRLNSAALGWRGAEREAEAAVDELQAALEESNGSLDVHDEKGRAAAAAVDSLAVAAIDAAQKKYDETQSVEEANAAYESYIGQLRQSLINAGHSEEAVDALIDEIARVPTYKATTFDMKVNIRIGSVFSGIASNINSLLGGVAAQIASALGMADGGIVTAATGRLQATSVSSPTVLFGERQTEEEAFVPKRGDRSRALSILGTAAGWHGAQVVPQGPMHSSSATPASVHVTVSPAPGSDQALMAAVINGLRFETEMVGGGSVQTHAGTRGRYTG